MVLVFRSSFGFERWFTLLYNVWKMCSEDHDLLVKLRKISEHDFLASFGEGEHRYGHA